MRDFADKKYPNNGPTNKKVKVKEKNSSYFDLVPAWLWFVAGMIVGNGLSYLPLLSSLSKPEASVAVQPSFDEKLAKEIQDLKITNEAATRALKEDLASIKRASEAAADDAKQAAKQAKIAAGQLEKSVEETKKKVEDFQQEVGNVKKLVQDKVENNEEATNSQDDIEQPNENLTDKKLADTTAPENKVNADKTKTDDSLNYDFYELLPQSEVKIDKEKTKDTQELDNSIYMLQVGSFRNEEDAKRHKQSLDKLKLGNSKIVEAKTNGDSWYRVYLGPYKTRRKSSEMQNILARSGFEAMQVKLK